MLLYSGGGRDANAAMVRSGDGRSIVPHTGVQGVTPGGGCKGACVISLALLPAGGLAVEGCLKE
ncbi:hypothetical protein VT03_17705 [Planctomyces sp. SH-PL14]|nr:hypothetical protein VT03_17705 [Planctomyces sp. SH-PL14]